MKSLPSYKKKLNECILKNKPLNLKDIIAERIIISESDGSISPEVLKEACFKVAKALEDYRKNTDFDIIHTNFNATPGKTDLSYLSKDYISNPKPSGYQSLHILSKDSSNSDCSYETQIRNCYMEDASKTDSHIAHTKYKKRYLDDCATSRVPKYVEVTNFITESGEPLVYEIPDELAFYHYYGVKLSTYQHELSKLEGLIDLEELHKKLKDYVSENKRSSDELIL